MSAGGGSMAMTRSKRNFSLCLVALLPPLWSCEECEDGIYAYVQIALVDGAYIYVNNNQWMTVGCFLMCGNWRLKKKSVCFNLLLITVNKGAF